MGDVYARYDPAFSVSLEEDEVVLQPDDLLEKQGDKDGVGILSTIGMEGLNAEEKAVITRRYLLNDLKDTADHIRLTKAIMREKVRQSRYRKKG
jgi:DNA-directed RNA polymerase sigma subunit (sigma70/sigma32)